MSINGTNHKPRKVVVQPQDSKFRYVPLTQNKIAIVDVNDYEELTKYNWFAWKPQLGRAPSRAVDGWRAA